ncbi:PepSY domain-containing protein [Shimia thalassica]|uniref:PepSY domain-containing protein n=1 Tax=Shimia thalassica TaxID=1715693 RepID=UPI002734179B|nr:PepSY domain-containing protein [Shimia thalassica]MDP2520599.1 PepSY domain-containing protein [Shimia thalassica]MDP2582025.1 PepSY domain-containing protein [Shimia thalassica]
MKQLLIILIGALATPVIASDDHDAARDAVRQQQVIPLMEIIPAILVEFDARLLEAEFEREHGKYVYELELITGAGRMIEVMVDATTGEILEVEQEDWQEGKD